MYIEQFVVENLNEHRKGILGKTMPVSHMLSWSKVCFDRLLPHLYFIHVQFIAFWPVKLYLSRPFLQRVSMACYAER